MKNKIIFSIAISILIVSFMVVAQGLNLSNISNKLGNVSIINTGSEWKVYSQAGDNYTVNIFDKNKQKTLISFCHKTITNQQDLPNKKDVFLNEEQNQSIQLNRKLKNGKVCYERNVDTETYLKFNPVVIYQEQNVINYDLDWASTNLTLFENVNGSWENTIENI